MKRRTLGAVLGTFLLAGGCAPSGCAPGSCGPSSPSTEGDLGNGSFSYECVDSNDNACDAPSTSLSSTSVPIPGPIAVGASFTIDYDSSTDHLALESASPSILTGSDGDFVFVQPGSAGVLVPATGGVLDFIVLQGDTIASVDGFDQESTPGGCRPKPGSDAGIQGGAGGAGGADAGGVGGAGGAGGAPTGGTGGSAADAGVPPSLPPAAALGAVHLVVGETLDLHLEPVNAGGSKLAGSVHVDAATVNGAVVSVGAPSFSLSSTHAFELCGVSAGDSALVVTVGAQQFSVRVHVESAP